MQNLEISHKMLASKQASKLDSIIYSGRAERPDEECPCVASAIALATQGLFLSSFLNN